MTRPHGAVFVSHASEDGEVAARICGALRAAGVEVWFDQSELRGGDAWDRQIRKQIHDCALFVAVISAHTNARTEGYFRREWRLAVDRTHDMADDAAFLLPVVVDDASDATARVPEPFRDVQWTHLPAGESPQHFVARVLALLATIETEPARPAAAPAPSAHANSPAPPGAAPAPAADTAWWRSPAVPWLLAIACVLVIGWLVLQRVPPARITAPSVPVAVTAFAPAASMQSIAVLPFLDMSEKHDQEYFSDGLTEELIDRLANLPGLHVPARTSSFHFKGQNTTIPEIARTLGVAHVLEGSVRKSGETLRITAQLIRAADGFHLWSKTYDRQMKDIFHVQDDIADQVVQALRVKLASPGSSQSGSRTENVQAHNLLLQGNFFAERSATGDNERAATLYEAAIKADPNYALAWTELAWARLWKYPPDSAERIEHAAQQAIQLDPGLAVAHATRGWVYSQVKHDFAVAGDEFDRALAVEPQNIRALAGKGQLARRLGRFDESIRYYQAALARDPVSTGILDGLSHSQLAAGRTHEAVDTYRRILEVSPGYQFFHGTLAWYLVYAGKPAEAMREAQLEPDTDARLSSIALAEQALGHRREADAALQELIARNNDLNATGIAGVYAARGDAAAAVTWLERAARRGLYFVGEVATDPDFRPIRGDPRFQAFLRKINPPA